MRRKRDKRVKFPWITLEVRNTTEAPVFEALGLEHTHLYQHIYRRDRGASRKQNRHCADDTWVERIIAIAVDADRGPQATQWSLLPRAVSCPLTTHRPPKLRAGELPEARRSSSIAKPLTVNSSTMS
jgi:hypothetical protein